MKYFEETPKIKIHMISNHKSITLPHADPITEIKASILLLMAMADLCYGAGGPGPRA